MGSMSFGFESLLDRAARQHIVDIERRMREHRRKPLTDQAWARKPRASCAMPEPMAVSINWG